MRSKQKQGCASNVRATRGDADEAGDAGDQMLLAGGLCTGLVIFFVTGGLRVWGQR
jgi:hypothetical protein